MRKFVLEAAVIAAILLLSGCGRDPGQTSAKNTWMHTFGSGVCNDVLLNSDGYYYMVGKVRAADNRNDIRVVKLDDSLEVIWDKSFEKEGNDVAYSAAPADDDGFVITGFTRSTDNETLDPFLLHLDENGKILWEKIYAGPMDEIGFCVRQTHDGGYIIFADAINTDEPISDAGRAGYFGHNGRSSFLMLKTDSEGNEIWREMHDNGNNTIMAKGLQTADGGYIGLATITYFPESDDNAIVIKTDQRGKQIWSHIFEEGRMAGFDIARADEDNYLLSCLYADAEDTARATADYMFIKIASNGKEIWRKKYGDPDMIDYAAELNNTSDGGFIAAGNTKKSNFGRNEDIKLMKIDSAGKLLWERVYEMATHNMYANVLQDPSGGFIISGSTIVEDGSFNMFLIKTDSEGQLID